MSCVGVTSPQLIPPRREKSSPLHYYGTEETQYQRIWEVASGVAQRPIHPGAWLLIPDLANVGHHTVVAGETLIMLADRWYGDIHLAGLIEDANNLPPGSDLTPGHVLIVPGLNRRANVAGDTGRVPLPGSIRRR